MPPRVPVGAMNLLANGVAHHGASLNHSGGLARPAGRRTGHHAWQAACRPLFCRASETRTGVSPRLCHPDRHRGPDGWVACWQGPVRHRVLSGAPVSRTSHRHHQCGCGGKKPTSLRVYRDPSSHAAHWEPHGHRRPHALDVRNARAPPILGRGPVGDARDRVDRTARRRPWSLCGMDSPWHRS